MKPGLPIGHQAELDWVVGSAQAIRLGGGAATVFCTPSMIHLMERTARKALDPWLEPGEEQVGVNVNVEHLAATPPGRRVRGVARVSGVTPPFVDFEVTAYDDEEMIGRGTHRRAVIELDRFQKRLARKLTAGSDDAAPTELPKFERLTVAVRDGLAEVALNRPDKLNAIDARMTNELSVLCNWLARQVDVVRVVILRGEGRSFCAGDDVREARNLSNEDILDLNTRRSLNCLAFGRLPQIFIAAIQGHCLGGGFMLAAACDFRLASGDARLGLPEIHLGWPPAYTNSIAAGLLGRARAMELALTGEPIPARRALEWGFLNQVVPGVRLMVAAKRLAGQLLKTPPRALREGKQRFQSLAGADADVSNVDDLAAFYRCLNSDEARRRLTGFGG